MPGVEQNLANWSRQWDWSQGGDEWSAWWGGTRAMWLGALLPRIHAFVPAGTVLEIAPGFGRWTQFLQGLADRLVIVDLTPECIDACRERFAAASNIDYHVNDGRSLDMVADGSIDLVFSFDSLVHAELDVLEAYLQQLARKLAPDGVGFIHHSNIGAYRPLTRLARRAPAQQFHRLAKRGLIIDLSAWRAESVTADAFARACSAAGLRCVTQELIAWERGPYLIDALSTFTRAGSAWDRPLQRIRNPLFRAEASRMAQAYAAPSFRR
jgi:SAM-dependent methyltransferase